MAETKYGKFIVSKYIPADKNAWQATYRPQDKTPLLRLDADIVKGASCFATCSWFWPAMAQSESLDRSTKPHSHTYHEVVGMMGTNPDDLHDLSGEAEINLKGEKNIVTKSCLIYLPAGMEHGPFRELKMARPIFQFEFGMAPRHL